MPRRPTSTDAAAWPTAPSPPESSPTSDPPAWRARRRDLYSSRRPQPPQSPHTAPSPPPLDPRFLDPRFRSPAAYPAQSRDPARATRGDFPNAYIRDHRSHRDLSYRNPHPHPHTALLENGQATQTDRQNIVPVASSILFLSALSFISSRPLILVRLRVAVHL
ncbi:hypothetical protein DFH06DRAFT_1313748 [Mycena polygramma]|nr:hypothetical protein DFH06DRAFT_1313748 [Mycena polygramma]